MSRLPSKNLILLALLGLTFVGLFFDIKFEHRDVLREEWTSYIPLVASWVAVVAVVLALLKSGKAHVLSAVLFVLIALTGLVGVYEHTKLRGYMFTRYFTEVDPGRGPNGRPTLKGWQRPTFAPMSFTLLGTLGFVLVFPGFKWPTQND